MGLYIAQPRSLHPIRWIFSVLLLASLITIGWYYNRWYTTGEEPPVPIPLASANPAIEEVDISKSDIDNHFVKPNEPRYLSIPKIGTWKARVLTGGVTKLGEIEAPRNINDVTWYSKSSLPGQKSGVILANGHNIGISRDGALAGLARLEPDDEVIIERGDGRQFIYRVSNSDSIPVGGSGKFDLSNVTKSHLLNTEELVIVTPDGKWVPQKKQFDRRLIVRAIRTS